jgi:hypothetical protein
VGEADTTPSFATDFPRRLEALDNRLAAFGRRLEAVSERLDGPRRRTVASGPHLLFVPSPAGYELLESAGPPPAVGSPVELPDRDGVGFAVVKLARSPLPDDARLCAYLEIA